MFIVGLTGGIASGKSTVAHHFERLGIAVIDADQVAREVVEPGEPALAKLREIFGETIIDAKGRLDRARMRDIAFADPSLRRQLEAVMHPAIGQRMQEKLRAANSPYVILMVPLLVETGQHRLVNRVLVVDVPEQQQLERLMARDGINLEQAKAILAAQTDREQRLEAAHDVIENTDSTDALADIVLQLHASYTRMVDQPELRARRFHFGSKTSAPALS